MPKRTDDEQSISIRVTPEQRERIKDAAKREDRTLSSFLRVAAMERADHVLGPLVGQGTTVSPTHASGQA